MNKMERIICFMNTKPSSTCIFPMRKQKYETQSWVTPTYHSGSSSMQLYFQESSSALLFEPA